MLQKTFSKNEAKEVIIKEAKTKEEMSLSSLAKKNAKQSLTEKLYDTQSNSNLIEQLAKKFDLNQNTNLIEVYDNSHIQGSDCVGALITFSMRVLKRKDKWHKK